MASDDQSTLFDYVTAISKRSDGANGLFEDIGSVASRIERTPLARDDEERDIVRRAHRKLLEREPLTRRESGLYEAIVLPTERPAMVVRNGTIAEMPERPWVGLTDRQVRRRIERAIAAVGRVDMSGYPNMPYAGTAFVVGPRLLMTNRHVAGYFSHGRGNFVRFVDGMGTAIDFARESTGRTSPSAARKAIPVARVVMVHPYWDMALVQVDTELGVAPLSLRPIAPAGSVGRDVVVIGHPGPDRETPQEILSRVFGSEYGVKRVQPGRIMGLRTHRSRSGGINVKALAHDASTLGGNSGSVVLDIETGDVVGLHFAGEYKVANYAVPADQLVRDDLVHEAGVKFESGAPVRPNPWQTEWQDADRRGKRGASAVSSVSTARPEPMSISAEPDRRPQVLQSTHAGGIERRIRIVLDVRVRTERGSS